MEKTEKVCLCGVNNEGIMECEDFTLPLKEEELKKVFAVQEGYTMMGCTYPTSRDRMRSTVDQINKDYILSLNPPKYVAEYLDRIYEVYYDAETLIYNLGNIKLHPEFKTFEEYALWRVPAFHDIKWYGEPSPEQIQGIVEDLRKLGLWVETKYGLLVCLDRTPSKW